MVLGHRQDVVVPDHREVGKAKDPPDLGRAEHLPERLLDPLLDLADLATQRREPAAGGVQHLAPAVEAALDRHGDPREFAHALPQAAQPRELVADPGEPAVEVADRAEGLDRLGQLLGVEDAPGLGARTSGPNVVQPAERGLQARAERLDHLGGQRLPMVNFAGVDARLDLECRGFAQRAGRSSGDHGADLGEFQ